MTTKTKITRKPKLSNEDEFPHYWKVTNKGADRVCATALVAEQLESQNILEGDILYFNTRFTFNENDLYVCESSANLYENKKSRLFVGFVYENFGDLSFYTPKKFVRRLSSKQVKILGVVTKIEREFKRIEFTEPEKEKEETKETEPKEITVTCCDCEKSATATKSFLTAMGWIMRNTYSRCISCL